MATLIQSICDHTPHGYDSFSCIITLLLSCIYGLWREENEGCFNDYPMSNILYGVSTSFALSQSRFLQSKSNENVSTQTVHNNTITGKDNNIIEVEETHVNTTTDSSDVAMDIDATLFAMDTKTNDVIEREPTFADLFDVMDDDTSESETHISNKDNDSSTSDFDFSDDEPENKKVRFSDDDNNIEMSPKANDDVALPSDGTNEISLNARNPSDRSMWCAMLICTVYIASNRQVSSCLVMS
jgi:hypothetical protein